MLSAARNVSIPRNRPIESVSNLVLSDKRPADGHLSPDVLTRQAAKHDAAGVPARLQAPDARASNANMTLLEAIKNSYALHMECSKSMSSYRAALNAAGASVGKLLLGPGAAVMQSGLSDSNSGRAAAGGALLGLAFCACVVAAWSFGQDAKQIHPKLLHIKWASIFAAASLASGYCVYQAGIHSQDVSLTRASNALLMPGFAVITVALPSLVTSSEAVRGRIALFGRTQACIIGVFVGMPLLAGQATTGNKTQFTPVASAAITTVGGTLFYLGWAFLISDAIRTRAELRACRLAHTETQTA